MEQAINTFELGLLMDLNPMQQSNKSLSGALNATLLTMNGNELVLLNDMGNARTKSGYLPKGYVPVGVKEYGGVIYIAAYNPITNLSLIGSFPSPLRINGDWKENTGLEFKGISDFCSTENNEHQRDIIKNVIIKLVGDNSILRTGDKFTLYGKFENNDHNILQDLSYVDGRLKWISLRVGVLSNTNEFVDITDNLVKFEVTNDYELSNQILNDSSAYYLPVENIEVETTDVRDYYFKIGEQYCSCKLAQPNITYYRKIGNNGYFLILTSDIKVGETDISEYFVKTDDLRFIEATRALADTDYYSSNYSYFLAKYPDESTNESNDESTDESTESNNDITDESNNNKLTNKNIDDLRKMKEVNTFSLKLSGPLCIKEILNIPENVNHNIDIEREDDTVGYTQISVEIGSDVSKYYTRTNNSEPYEYEPATGQALESTYYYEKYIINYNYTIKPTVYFSGESFPYHDEEFNNIRFKFKIGNLEKEISEFTYNLSEGVLEVTSNDITYEYEPSEINTPINYTITPYFENTEENNKKYINYIKQLEITGSIDLSKVNSGLVELKGFRYFNENSQTTLSLEIESYPKKNLVFSDLRIEFYEDKTNNLIGTYYTHSQNINGKFSYIIDWENSLIKDEISVSLEDRTIYKLKFKCSDSSLTNGLKEIDSETDYWILTTSLFNSCYSPFNNNYIKNYCKRTGSEETIYDKVTTIPITADWVETDRYEDVDIDSNENLISVNELPEGLYFGWKETKTYTSNITGKFELNLDNPLFPKDLKFSYKENPGTEETKPISEASFNYGNVGIDGKISDKIEEIDYVSKFGDFEKTSDCEIEIDNEIIIKNQTVILPHPDGGILINRSAITTGICYYNSEVGEETLKILTPITDHFTSESTGKIDSDTQLKTFKVPFRFENRIDIPLDSFIDIFPRISFSPGTSNHHINIIESSINIEDTKDSTGAGIAKDYEDYEDAKFNSYRVKAMDQIQLGENGELPTSMYMYGITNTDTDEQAPRRNKLLFWTFGKGTPSDLTVGNNKYFCGIYKENNRLLFSSRGNNLTIKLLDYITQSYYLQNAKSFIACGLTSYYDKYNNIWIKPLIFLKSENGWGLLNHPFKILYGNVTRTVTPYIECKTFESEIYDGDHKIYQSNYPDPWMYISSIPNPNDPNELIENFELDYSVFSLYSCFGRIIYGLKHIYAPNPSGIVLSNYYMAGNEYIKTNTYKYTFNSTIEAKVNGNITINDDRFRVLSTNDNVSVQIPLNVNLGEYINGEIMDQNPKSAIQISENSYIFANSYIMKKTNNDQFESCNYFNYNPDANGREDLKITANLSDQLTYDVNLPIDRSYNDDYVTGTMSLKDIPALNFEKLYK